ncbi:ATP synthase F1 subunit delta [bacterium]|nr:MAG: ATP synthase F1 subunit delta [bacterium]
MAIDSRIGRRYAQALFSVALQHGMVRGVEDDLDALAGLYQDDPRFHELLTVPQTSREEKIRQLEALFGDRATALTMQVLRLMVEKGREASLPNLRDEFVELRRANEGVIYASVSSAVLLTPEEKNTIVAKLGTTLGKTVEATFELNPGLLGGVRVEYDNYVLDGSVRGSLNRMREKLRTDFLKQA